MQNFTPNPRCNCGRCRMAGMMGPAVLVTLGILFLLQQSYDMSFQWPILLIVIGIVKILQYSAPMENHRPLGAPPIVTPPPVAPAGELPSQQPRNPGEEARHG